MLLHIQIDLSAADLALFEAYEAEVLPLLAHHDGVLTARFRSIDGRTEIHLIEFADATALERYRADPRRAAAQPLWQRSGAVATMTQVVTVPGP